MTWWVAGSVVVGSVISSNGAQDAAQTQAGASQAAIDEQRRQYDQTRADYAPYRQAGVQALGQLQGDINSLPTANEVMADPGYQFGLSQGQQALDRKASAAGGRVSGAALKAASQYATDYATTGLSTTAGPIESACFAGWHRPDIHDGHGSGWQCFIVGNQQPGKQPRQCGRCCTDRPREHLGQRGKPARCSRSALGFSALI
jgi:hypothetical protein